VGSGHPASDLRDAVRGHPVRRGLWLRPMGVDSGQFRLGIAPLEAMASGLALAVLDSGGVTSGLFELHDHPGNRWGSEL
jgi:hypothetical protein